jgi:membrane protein implicated in regulation of membrane protease activity
MHDLRVVLLLVILLVVFASVPAPWNVVLIAIACVLEVFEIILLRRWAGRLDRRTKQTTGAEALIGEAAQVVEPCRPEGTVHVNGELWQARCDAGADTGDVVRITSLDGLTLVVAR